MPQEPREVQPVVFFTPPVTSARAADAEYRLIHPSNGGPDQIVRTSEAPPQMDDPESISLVETALTVAVSPPETPADSDESRPRSVDPSSGVPGQPEFSPEADAAELNATLRS